jgi:hypothetical protein
LIGGDIVDVGLAVESAVGRTVVSIRLSLGIELREALQSEGPCFVLVNKHFIFCHLFFGEIVSLIHLPNKEGFGFLGDDDIDGLAFFL